jgi:hypothetical protein
VIEIMGFITKRPENRPVRTVNTSYAEALNNDPRKLFRGSFRQTACFAQKTLRLDAKAALNTSVMNYPECHRRTGEQVKKRKEKSLPASGAGTGVTADRPSKTAAAVLKPLKNPILKDRVFHQNTAAPREPALAENAPPRGLFLKKNFTPSGKFHFLYFRKQYNIANNR